MWRSILDELKEARGSGYWDAIKWIARGGVLVSTAFFKSTWRKRFSAFRTRSPVMSLFALVVIWLSIGLVVVPTVWFFLRPPKPSPMVFMRELFERDISSKEGQIIAGTAQIPVGDGSRNMIVDYRMVYDVQAGSKYFGVYAINVFSNYKDLKALPAAYPRFFAEISSRDFAVTIPVHGAPIKWRDLPFTGVVYLYWDGEMSEEERGEIVKLHREAGYTVKLRGAQYMIQQNPNFFGSPAR